MVGSDGRQSTFVLPYASAIDILRDGASRFSLGMGVLDESGINADPLLLQGSYLPDDFERIADVHQPLAPFMKMAGGRS